MSTPSVSPPARIIVGPVLLRRSCGIMLMLDSRKFAMLYKDYHNENKAVNAQPPTSAQYYLRLYPRTIERDALLESAEVDYQSK